MEISDEARRIARKQWKRRMEECGHPAFSYVDIDGREYAICDECQWICNGPVARLRTE